MIRAGGWSVLVLVLGLAALVPVSEARPWRGNPEVVVIMCEAGDADTLDLSRAPPGFQVHATRPYFKPSAQLVRDKLVSVGTGSVADFYRHWSNGVLDWRSVRVFGWLQMKPRWEWFGIDPATGLDAFTGEAPNNSVVRSRIRGDCVARAAAEPAWRTNPPSPQAIKILIVHPFVDMHGVPSARTAVLPQNFEVGDAVHEIGHALGLWDSFREIAIGPTRGEVTWYGDHWDAMSWQTSVFPVPSSWSRTGPGPGSLPAGLAGASMDFLGFLPSTRVVTHGADGRTTAQYCLAPIDEPQRGGLLMVRVPLSTSDPFRYLTIEYRSRNGPYGAGITAGMGHQALVRRAQRDRPAAMHQYLLMEDLAKPGGPPSRMPPDGHAERVTDAMGQVVGRVQLRVLVEDAQGCSAIVEVKRDTPVSSAELAWLKEGIGPNRCIPGLVARDLDPYDHTCVTPAVRAQHQSEGSRWLGFGTFPSGWTQQCPLGLQQRNAFPGDDTCVTPGSAQQAASDNVGSQARFAYDRP